MVQLFCSKSADTWRWNVNLKFKGQLKSRHLFFDFQFQLICSGSDRKIPKSGSSRRKRWTTDRNPEPEVNLGPKFDVWKNVFASQPSPGGKKLALKKATFFQDSLKMSSGSSPPPPGPQGSNPALPGATSAAPAASTQSGKQSSSHWVSLVRS